jgi:hypothetical protein
MGTPPLSRQSQRSLLQRRVESNGGFIHQIPRPKFQCLVLYLAAGRRITIRRLTSRNVEHVVKRYLVNRGEGQLAIEQQHKEGMLAVYDKVSAQTANQVLKLEAAIYLGVLVPSEHQYVSHYSASSGTRTSSLGRTYSRAISDRGRSIRAERNLLPSL